MGKQMALKQSEQRELVSLRTSPKEYLLAMNPRHIEDVVDSPVPSVITIVKECGENVARAALVIIITELLSFFNVENTMSVQQVATTISLLMDEYYYLKLDDFKMCFKRVMLGKYGKVYNRIDGQMILEWVHTYLKERTEVADELSYNAHKASKNTPFAQGLFYGEYRKQLEEQAAAGDEEAKKRLAMSDSIGKKFKAWKEEDLKRRLDSYEQWKKENGN